MSPDDEVIVALSEQHAELDRLLDNLESLDWSRPSRCDGWSVSDVVLHLAQTDEMALASLDDRMAEMMEQERTRGPEGRSVDDGAADMVAAQRGDPPEVVRQRWRNGAADVRRRLVETDASRRVTWVAGQLSARTLASTRLAEAWIHTGDIADALDVELSPTDRLRHIARLAWRTLPYAFARAGRELSGPVAFELDGPTGAGWDFRDDAPAATVIRGDGTELCLVAARRLEPSATGLSGHGPDVDAVLSLVRTYA